MSDGENAIFAALSFFNHCCYLFSSHSSPTNRRELMRQDMWRPTSASFHSSTSPHQVFSHQISAGLEGLIELVPSHREGPCGYIIAASMIIIILMIIIIIIIIIIIYNNNNNKIIIIIIAIIINTK